MDKNKLKILLIEDNPGDARLAIEFLKEKNYCENFIDHVTSLKEADNKFQENIYDVVLLDLNLPDCNMNETVTTAQSICCNCPIIILTGTYNETIEIESVTNGIQEYLVKGNINSNSLDRCIRNSILRFSNEIKIKELNQFNEQLISILSHDLRSPFNALIGYIDLTMEDLESVEMQETFNNLSNIKCVALNIYEMISNLFEWSKLQDKRIEPHPVKFKFSDFKTQSIKLQKLLAINKNIELLTSDSDDVTAYADFDMMDTVVRNLINNAIKFSSEGSTIRIGAESNDSKTLIFVEDKGVGIPKDNIHDILNPTKRVSTPGTRNERGSGLGLALCKKFVEINGGNIFVESELNKGTKISFTIPSSN